MTEAAALLDSRKKRKVEERASPPASKRSATVSSSERMAHSSCDSFLTFFGLVPVAETCRRGLCLLNARVLARNKGFPSDLDSCFPPLVQVLIRARVCPDFAPGRHGESSSMSRSSHRSVREEGGHRERGKERRGRSRSRSHSRERDGRSGKSVRYVRKEDKTRQDEKEEVR